MCGLAGFLEPAGGREASAAAELCRRMTDTLVHRGPDDGDVWVDAAAGIGLGHRRLSIIDLSPAGHQPMVSACGRYVIVYNGEVYSHEEMRPALLALGKTFRGHSDTEVILEGCAAWGVERTVEQLIGMFAFALWDRQERILTLARDRLGIKPLYWAKAGETIIFGSEMKALRQHPSCPTALDLGALGAYLRHNYIPAPLTIHAGVRKLPPGHILTIRPGREPEERAFWSLSEVVAEAHAAPFGGDDAAAVESLDALLRDAVGRRMVADVPLGAFLSGGVDSSTVVALMQAQSSRPVKTFTIGFHERGYDEAQHAKAVAAHLGTEHTELYVDPRHALDTIPRLAEWYDEPFADSSQIPTFLVSEMTRSHVTVALSGDGGDELFAGYNRYLMASTLWRRLKLVPRPLRHAAAALIRAVPPKGWDRVAGALRLPLAQPGDKAHKAADVLALDDPDALYRRLVSHMEPSAYLAAPEARGLLWDPSVRDAVPDYVERMQYLDALTYLPDDILTKVDRASMAVALEARVPLLDHRVVRFAFGLPMHMRIRGGDSKWLLRQVLYRYVPKELIERPKMGFGIPIDSWLRGQLRDWAEALLSTEGLRDGRLDPKPVRHLWAEHLSGRRNHAYRLWNVLMYQAWRERWTR